MGDLGFVSGLHQLPNPLIPQTLSFTMSTATTTTDTLDPTVRTLLYDIQRVSGALRILKQKCGEGNTSVNSRALGSPLGGLDSYSLREILDRLFGESDGGSSLTNWADACDHAPFKLYKSYRENIVEVGVNFLAPFG